MTETTTPTRRRLGSQGPEITTVGFGAWAVGGAWKMGWGNTDDDESIAAIRRAVEGGVTWVDTAAVYGLGHSEEVVGRALEPFEVGEEVLVFTKCGRVPPIRRAGDHEFARARVDPPRVRGEPSPVASRAHRPVPVPLARRGHGHGDRGLLGTMAELVDEGKVRWAGVSNFDRERLERCEAIRHVDSLLLPHRPARTRRSPPWCRENGTGVIVYSPMASGLLTGAFSRERVERLPRRLAPRSAALPGAPARAQPRAGRAPGARGRRRGHHPARPGRRLGARPGGGHRGDRGRAPPRSGGRLAARGVAGALRRRAEGGRAGRARDQGEARAEPRLSSARGEDHVGGLDDRGDLRALAGRAPAPPRR